MMAEQLKPKQTIKDEVKRFIFDWHAFPLDYWWRRRYHVPFGSQAHREMNFIDMYIEYQEERLLQETHDSYEEEEDSRLGIKDDNVVKVSKEEIDNDYDNLDLSQFDKKE